MPLSDSIHDEPTAGHPASWFSAFAKRLARIGPAQRAAAAFILYFTVRWLILGATPPIAVIDTPSYAEQYRGGFSEGFFGRGRSWCYPFIFWLAGHNEQFVVWAQRVVAVLAWFALALAVRGLFRSGPARRVAFWGTLVMSVSLFSVMWDAFLLSEGFTIYFFVGLTAAWIFLLRSVKTGLLPLAVLVVMGILFAGMRDASLPMLIAYCPAVTATVLLRHYALGGLPRRVLAGSLALIGLLLLVVMLQMREARACHRNWQSIGAVLSFRAYSKDILNVEGETMSVADVENIRWLEEHYQLPVNDALARINMTVYQPPPLRPVYRDWLMQKGASAWLGFLLHHPAFVWDLFNSCTIYSLTASGVQYIDSDAKKWKTAHLDPPIHILNGFQVCLQWLLAWNGSNMFFTMTSLVLGIAAVLMWMRPGLRGAARIIGVLSWLIGTSAAGAFIALFGDYGEPWRHAIVGLIALYAAVPVILAIPVDFAWRFLAGRRGGPRVHAETVPAPAPPPPATPVTPAPAAPAIPAAKPSVRHRKGQRRSR